MSVSLIGIIFIQSFFIIKNYQENEKQFTSNVNYVLGETATMVERMEFRKYVTKFKDLINSESLIDTSSINNLIIIEENQDKRETILYRNGVIEENLIIPKSKDYLDELIGVITENENISIQRLSNRREEKVFTNQRVDNINSEEFLLKLGKISKSKEILFETAYNDLAKRKPIEDRIGDKKRFEDLLQKNLNKMNIDLDFEYGIFNKDSITSISSNQFKFYKQNYSSPVFKDENELTDYSLKVVFPARTPFLLSSLISVIITSVIFTSIIIIADNAKLIVAIGVLNS